MPFDHSSQGFQAPCLSALLICGISSQFSPAATMQVSPFGIVMMIVQLDPVLLDRTSTTPPLLASPSATGASVYFADRC